MKCTGTYKRTEVKASVFALKLIGIFYYAELLLR